MRFCGKTDYTLAKIQIMGFRGQTWRQLTRNQMIKLRARTVRSGAWFRALNRAERAYMELAIKVVEKVRSRLVAKVLASIIQKLSYAFQNRVEHAMKKIGRVSAKKLSRIAQNWGNISSIKWATDPKFTRFLSIMHLNRADTFRV